MSIYSLATRFFRDQLAGSWVPAYLARRGLPAVALEQWDVGYAPAGRDTLVRHLRSAGYADELIAAAGLARWSTRGYLNDLFRDRAMLPVRSPRDAVVAFIGRGSDCPERDSPKYLNSPTSTIYVKSSVLFGLPDAYQLLASGATPVIVEGPLDVMAVATAGDGRYAPVAPCGGRLTAAQAQALSAACDLRSAGALVAFDADRAGRRAAACAYRTLSPFTDRLEMMIMPDGYDPARVLADHGAGLLVFMLAECRRPLADQVIDEAVGPWLESLRFAEGQVAALRAVAPLVASLPPVEVGRQVSRLAAHLRLDTGLVTSAVVDAVASQAAS